MKTLNCNKILNIESEYNNEINALKQDIKTGKTTQTVVDNVYKLFKKYSHTTKEYLNSMPRSTTNPHKCAKFTKDDAEWFSDKLYKYYVAKKGKFGNGTDIMNYTNCTIMVATADNNPPISVNTTSDVKSKPRIFTMCFSSFIYRKYASISKSN